MFFQKKIKCKDIQFVFFIFSIIKLPMKIIFTSSYKTYFKNNTENYVTNYYVLVFLISVIFFVYNMGRRNMCFLTH